MEEYTDVNNKYIDDMTALRLYMWRRFTEPTIVEEEAFAQMKGTGVLTGFNIGFNTGFNIVFCCNFLKF